MNQRVDKFLTFAHENLPFCCGVKDVGDFDYYEEPTREEPAVEEFDSVRRSGTGLFTATFVNNHSNQKAYEYLVSKYKLLYQSPVKNNDNSRNDLFLCVFDYDTDQLPNL